MTSLPDIKMPFGPSAVSDLPGVDRPRAIPLSSPVPRFVLGCGNLLVPVSEMKERLSVPTSGCICTFSERKLP